MGARVSSKARLRAIPAVEKVLQALGAIELPRPVIVAAVRRDLAARRARKETAPFETIVAGIRTTLERLRASRIQPVINGTGIIIHTNLGRAPLSARATEAVQTIAAHYNNLEYDLPSGERGRRGKYVEDNLALLCGAEAATVVNNCAAALILILRYFTARKPEVIISRGELIQIGGGFRIPEILETSGATLCEVGTTNKTTLADYAGAIGPQTGLILKVHRSNFFMSGFVESPSTADIAGLARRKRIALVEDLGSGAVLRDDETGPLAGEPIPRESLKAGAQLICFSGDKLFGGPQAGIIAGNGRLVAALKREPFFRALRCDKLILAALQTTSELHLQNLSRGKMDAAIPVQAMLQMSEEELRVRAEKIVAALHHLPLAARAGKGQSQLGGGSSPRAIIPSVTVELIPKNESLAEFAARLRVTTPPMVGYVAGGKFKLDLRTIFASQDDEVVRAITSVCRDSAV